MSSSTLIEVFGHIVFSFTRGVTEHYNPQEPDYTAESFGYDPLQSTGREWYYHPVDELIYQEYSDREATSLDYLTSNHPDARVINACSPEENEETQEDQQHEDGAMAWKPLRPSALRTVCKSMFIGALISPLTAIIIGSVYLLISYISSKTVDNCEFHPKKSIPLNVQWTRSILLVTSYSILHFWTFVIMLFLFRPYQLMGVKMKVFLACCFGYCLDAFYIIALQALGISHSKPSSLQLIPANILMVISLCLQVYFLTNHFCIGRTRRSQVNFFLQMTASTISLIILAVPVAQIIYPVYNKQNEDGSLLISLAITTRYQNIAVMAVWQRRWKKHISIATITAALVALSSTKYLLPVLHDRFNKFSNQTCKMPFT